MTVPTILPRSFLDAMVALRALSLNLRLYVGIVTHQESYEFFPSGSGR